VVTYDEFATRVHNVFCNVVRCAPARVIAKNSRVAVSPPTLPGRSAEVLDVSNENMLMKTSEDSSLNNANPKDSRASGVLECFRVLLESRSSSECRALIRKGSGHKPVPCELMKEPAIRVRHGPTSCR
jgi:hypothetical protein